MKYFIPLSWLIW